ncbi:hypothetical protein H9P43_005339 [Blastocladiella emersonii ATCC 22665]|nr:hypothetical protein H9P43_005339 [Blastocladiella emersonii ATCC 22665]
MPRRTRASRLLLLAVLAILAATAAAQKCPTRVRKEVRDLSLTELDALKKGFWELNRRGVMAKFTRLHVEHKEKGHFNPSFLPFHRAMLKHFEDELLAVAPGLSGLPYWDSTYDAKDPAKSAVLAPDFFGSAKKGCIADGPFVGLKREDGTCVRRDLVPGPWNLDQSMIVSLLRLYPDNFDRFAYYLERGPHFVVHSNIGGDMYTLVDSPNDPIFILHHCSIDRWWAMFQGTSAKAATSYGGEANGRTYVPSDAIMDFTVSDLFDYRGSSRLCYTFQDPRFPRDGIASRKPGTTNATATNLTNTAVPDFKPLSDAFLAGFGVKPDQMVVANRMFVAVTRALQQVQKDGKPLPTFDDLRNLTALAEFEAQLRKSTGDGGSGTSGAPTAVTAPGTTIKADAAASMAAVVSSGLVGVAAVLVAGMAVLM